MFQKSVSALLILFIFCVPEHPLAQSDLTGVVTEEQLSEHSPLFQVYVDRYDPDPALLDSLSSVTGNYELLIVMGTWCRESKRYIPELSKTLKMAGNTNLQASYTAVGYPRMDDTGVVMEYAVNKIPTIIILKEGMPVGRIEEKPDKSMESDLWQIINAADR